MVISPHNKGHQVPQSPQNKSSWTMCIWVYIGPPYSWTDQLEWHIYQRDQRCGELQTSSGHYDGIPCKFWHIYSCCPISLHVPGLTAVLLALLSKQGKYITSFWVSYKYSFPLSCYCSHWHWPNGLKDHFPPLFTAGGCWGGMTVTMTATLGRYWDGTSVTREPT